MTELNNPAIYQTVLDALETGVYIVDPNRRIRFWNEGAEKITGYLRQDVVGHFLRDHLLTASDRTGDLDSDPNYPINIAFRDGKSSLMSVSILHKEGYRLPITLRTNPVRNSHGAVIGAAESFDKVQPFLDSTRRHSGLADFGCLDVLTGVAAQGFMDTKIRENLITFAEHHVPFGVLLLQIDDLDQHKTKRGPGVVATILRIIAQSIENCLRPTDILGCWRKYQFLAILTDCKESEVALVAERTRRIIGRSEIEWWGDKFSVTSPMGGAGSRLGTMLKV